MIHDYPLTKVNRIHLAQAFRAVPRVDLSIDCVLEGQMGRAFVDDPARPGAYQIQAWPFFYFAGRPDCPGANEMLQNIAPYTLFMPSAPGWIEAAQEMYGDRLRPHDRYRFTSEDLSAAHLRKMCTASPLADRVQRMDTPFAAGLWGQDHFVDLSSFDSPEDFIDRSAGFYVESQGEVSGAALGTLVCSKGIEVSIFILPEFRRQGMATILAAHLLLWGLENHMDADWDAANPESCKLAMKLGYKFVGSYEAYVLQGP